MASYPDAYVDDGWIWLYYDVTDISSPTPLVASSSALNQFDASFEIDGVSVAKAQTYQFSATGEHLVKMKRSGALAAGTFSAINTLKRVYLSSTVTELTGSNYGGAFYNCAGLTHVQLPSTLTSIGSSVFKYCSALEVINLDGHTGITTLGQEAFNGCSSMAVDVELPNLSSVSGAVFRNTAITKVLDLGTVTSLPNTSSMGFFQGCANLTEVVLPATLTTLGVATFRDCSNLTDINLVHDGITSIGQESFRNCSKMEVEVDLPNLSSLGGCVFTSSGITKVINLGSITSLPNVSSAGAFHGCTKLTEANLPGTLTSIGVSAFSGCAALVKVNIHKESEITSIGQNAFYGCSSLPRIVLPVSLTSINGWAFSGCSGLKEMVCYAITPPTLSNNPLGGLTGIQKIYVNPQSVDTYKSATGWSSFSAKIFPLWSETPIAINHLSLGDFRRRIMIGISTPKPEKIPIYWWSGEDALNANNQWVDRIQGLTWNSDTPYWSPPTHQDGAYIVGRENGGNPMYMNMNAASPAGLSIGRLWRLEVDMEIVSFGNKDPWIMDFYSYTNSSHGFGLGVSSSGTFSTNYKGISNSTTGIYGPSLSSSIGVGERFVIATGCKAYDATKDIQYLQLNGGAKVYAPQAHAQTTFDRNFFRDQADLGNGRAYSLTSGTFKIYSIKFYNYD